MKTIIYPSLHTDSNENLGCNSLVKSYIWSFQIARKEYKSSKNSKTIYPKNKEKNIFPIVCCTPAGLFRVTFSHFLFICERGDNIKSCD